MNTTLLTMNRTGFDLFQLYKIKKEKTKNPNKDLVITKTLIAQLYFTGT